MSLIKLLHGGTKLVRLYQSDKGIWRYDFERSGKTYWSSLHTRDEHLARAAYERLNARLDEARKELAR